MENGKEWGKNDFLRQCLVPRKFEGKCEGKKIEKKNEKKEKVKEICYFKFISFILNFRYKD